MKAHRQSITKKRNVRSVAEAVPIAAKLGIHSAPVDGADARCPMAIRLPVDCTRVSAPLQDSSEDDGFADFSPAATGRCLINDLSTSNDSCYAAEASRTAATSSEYRFLRPSMNTSSGLSGSGFAPGMP